MNQNWYPQELRVGPLGTPSTYNFMTAAFNRFQHFHYAELGIYKADTTDHVCDLFPNATIHIFDYHEKIESAKLKLGQHANRIHGYGATQKYNDSYNWSLLKLVEENDGNPVFDYCFLDGAHTVSVDALAYFLCDKLLRIGGYMDFDDYGWRMRGSSMDPSRIPETSLQYTEEQIDAYQVKMIVDTLVRRDARYREIVKDKIFQKIA
jgi:hypothetical protein